MDVVALVAVGVFVFCLGWATGNIIEWVLVSRERRLNEAKVAEVRKQMFLEGRRDREC